MTVLDQAVAAVPVPLAAPPGLAFELPEAQRPGGPPESRGLARDEVRLMVSAGREAPLPASFRDLPRHLRAGDLLVVNTSATIPALLEATWRGRDGRRVRLEVRLVTPLPPHPLWVVELPATAAWRRPAGGEALRLAGGGDLHLLASYGDSGRRRAGSGQPRLWTAALHLPAARARKPARRHHPWQAGATQVDEYLHAYGRPVRPPGVTDDWPLDAYQTCFARHPGSTAMPSAGRPFTPELLCELLACGIAVAPLCLHTCGVADADDAPLPEPFEVPAATAQLVNATRAGGGRVIAVGTTVARALETVTDRQGYTHPGQGVTSTVITPEHGLRGCDGLLTGWHEPNGSHLHLLEALAGVEPLEWAYGAALERRYAWGTFGDLHLILRELAGDAGAAGRSLGCNAPSQRKGW